MATLFFDSSGLVKRYIAETGTSWVVDLLRPSAANEVFISGITGIEVASAIARRLKAGSLDQAAATNALFRFKRDFAKLFIVIDLTPTIIEHGISLAEKHDLRGYDTTQLAVALAVNNPSATGRNSLARICIRRQRSESGRSVGRSAC